VWQISTLVGQHSCNAHVVYWHASRVAQMAIDTDRIDDCVLALLLLGRHDGSARLEVVRLGCDGTIARERLTDEGLDKAERLFRDLFVTIP
jgi:hypothetical protein